MTRTLLFFFCVAIVCAQSAYKKPPASVLKVLNAPATPVANTNPTRTHLLLLEPDRYPPIAELGEPMLRLAGLRINPRNNGQRGGIHYGKAELIDLTTLRKTRLAVPAGAQLGAPQWSRDGRTAAMLAYYADRIDVMLLNSATGTLRTLAGVRANAAYGDPIDWMADGKRLLVRTVVAGRGAAPEAPLTPVGPDIQESLGKAAPAPTFQDLLRSAHDEKLFDYYCTSQATLVDVTTGRATAVGKPAIFSALRPSPDGKYLLAQRLRRPYSWVLPAARFPVEMEVWRLDGTVVRAIASLPLADRVPLDGVRTGPRSMTWAAGQGAALTWWEAMDGGNPKEKVPHRDRMMIAAAPFDQPREFAKLEERLQGTPLWTSDGRLWVSDYERRTRRQRTFLVGTDGVATELESRNQQDRYRAMGTPVTAASGEGGREIRVERGGVLLTGTGATPAGDRPFLDRMDLVTKQKARLFVSGEGVYETVVTPLNSDGTRLLTRRESPTEPPNYYLIDNGTRTALTQFVDPAPELRRVTKKLVKYKRADGVPLSFTLYLPPDYKEGTALPTVVWAYPRDFSDADTAGQVSGSPNRFTTVSGTSHLFFLLQGYAILDDASLPVVGDLESFNNSYLEQVVAGAKAAIDKAVEMGVTDPRRVGVGGHSYGAFMTANLLAHSDLFAAGIARSGAYNRTLTPFGFQTERRTLWEAPETYLRMSPFLSAQKINEPILLIHGAADNNTGTFPIQSERMYTAIRGNGGTVRFVLLPHESHGYAARESVEHTLAEMVEWFDKHVKNRQ
ncbi:MAG: S9 family peptidase [Bryobacterales bacterium]|nr:S9 family peptidase [Bryobacterales bacterium]